MTVTIIAASVAILAGSALYFAILLVIRAWLEHRIQKDALVLLQRDPELLENPERLRAALAETTRALQPSQRILTPLTGVFVALIGAGAWAWGANIRVGQLAVGLYVGGQACVALGLVCILMSMALRRIQRADH